MIHYKNNQLHIDNISLQDIAKQYHTPCYVYSAVDIEQAYKSYTAKAHAHTSIHYAVKANSNLSIIKLLYNLGAGFDIVSVGELQRVIAATQDCSRVIFSGVGKSCDEIEYALKANIMCFNVESIAELHRIQSIASKLNIKAPISLRINPDVDAKTHPYISTGLKNNKFGIAFDCAIESYKIAASMSHLTVIGIDCHIGSQILDTLPFFDALQKILDLVTILDSEKIYLKHIDIGGGIGINYQEDGENQNTPNITCFVEDIQNYLAKTPHANKHLIFEPGRSIVGNAGVLLCKVEHIKHTSTKNFCIVDAGMNDLARPAMYEAYHAVQTLNEPLHNDASTTYDIVGPVCESGDWLARDRNLQIKENDYLAILSAGSYGFTMSSNYNTRPRATEVLIQDETHRCIRERETVESLFALEMKYL
jgi:diaminopimelate decarboxylase